MVLVKQVACF